MMLGAGQNHVLGRTQPYDVIEAGQNHVLGRTEPYDVRGGTGPCFGQDPTI